MRIHVILTERYMHVVHERRIYGFSWIKRQCVTPRRAASWRSAWR